jgi:acyl-CoA synthetase (AMP-forming)/AMP-acid ligase II
MPADANIARHLGAMAIRQPNQVALKVPRGRTRGGDIDYLVLTFAELDKEVRAWCDRLAGAGVSCGDRTLVMVRQGLPLIGSVFALFRLGAVPVVIDPGMGLRSFLGCVERSRPRVLVGIPIARLIAHFFRRPFRTLAVASGSLTSRLRARGRTARNFDRGTPSVERGANDLAAVLFTSGSTGAPKGVSYEHGMFEAQVSLIRETYAIEPGEIDLPLLPLFALFNPALGMATIVPELDPRRPAAVDPGRIVQAIRQEQVTNTFGSPTLWNRIGSYCESKGMALPSLRRVLCAGAPVPSDLWRRARSFLPMGRLHSPYGATEALPVASVADGDWDPDSLQGACVGRPLPSLRVRIIRISDGTVRTLADTRELPAGEIGEIIVSGPVVTKVYDGLPEATAAAKIREVSAGNPTDGSIWHRMGDCGFLDAERRLWFCGRKAERVFTGPATFHTEPCERVFRRHPRAGCCALIGLGEYSCQVPAVVVETKIRNSSDGRKLARELRLLALQHDHTAAIRVFYFHPCFPVDVRHNAKIHRRTLAHWARTAKGFESDPKR